MKIFKYDINSLHSERSSYRWLVYNCIENGYFLDILLSRILRGFGFRDSHGSHQDIHLWPEPHKHHWWHNSHLRTASLEQDLKVSKWFMILSDSFFRIISLVKSLNILTSSREEISFRSYSVFTSTIYFLKFCHCVVFNESVYINLIAQLSIIYFLVNIL